MAAAALLTASGTSVAQFPIGEEFRVNTHTAATQRLPAAAALPGFEEFIVVWESASQDGDESGIVAQRYAAFGVPAGPEFRANTYTTSSQHAPAVASRHSQSVIVVWQSDGQDGDQGGVFAQRFSGGSGVPLGGEFRVNSHTTSIQGVPSVASDGAGNFVVVWAGLGQDGSDYGVFGQRYGSDGAPLGGEFRVNTYTTGFQGHPAVARDSNGDFVVAWDGEGVGDEPFGIFAQRYSPSGVPMGGEFRVNSFTGGDQRYPAVEAGTNRFLVVWQSDGQDGSGYGIYGQPYNFFTGNPEGSQHLVNTYTTGSQSHPRVSLSLAWGLDCIVVWQSDQDPQGGIFGQFYYGFMTPIFQEFRVNTTTAGAQSGPAIVNTGQSIVVSWSSDQDPDASLGVYGQLYFAPWLPVDLQYFTVE